MAIDYDSGTGLFDVLGGYIKTASNIRANYQQMLATRYATHTTLRASADREHASALQSALEDHQATATAVLDAIYNAAQAEVIDAANAEVPLASLTIAEALAVLADEMETDAADLTHSAAGSAVAYGGSNTGTGKAVVALIDGNGDGLQYVFSEDIVLECISDAQEGGSETAGNELFKFYGEQSVTRTSPDWPAGSGCVGALHCASGSQYAARRVGQNILANSNFERFTSNLPDRFETVVGSAGTDFGSTTTKLVGSKSLYFEGDGATLPSIRQELNAPTTGSERTLKPSTVYCLGAWIRHSGSAPAAGVLRISVKDSGGTILDSGSAYVSWTLSTLSSTFAFSSVVFNSPAAVPTTVYLVAELTTALDSGKIVYIDEIVLQEMTELYRGGPRIALFRGDTNWVVGDTITLTITNNNSSSNLIHECDRLLGLREYGVRLPTAGSGSISDGLIT